MKIYTYLGIVNDIDENGYACMEQRNKFCVGDEVEIMKPSGENVTVTVKAMLDQYGKETQSCPHPQEKIKVLFSEKPDIMDLIRVKEEENK